MKTAYYYVIQNHLGRWCVVHNIPGTTVPSVDADCLTRGAAEREAAWMNFEREQEAGYAVDAAGTFTG